MSPVEYASGNRSLRTYIAVCLQRHCYQSSCACLVSVVSREIMNNQIEFIIDIFIVTPVDSYL